MGVVNDEFQPVIDIVIKGIFKFIKMGFCYLREIDRIVTAAFIEVDLVAVELIIGPKKFFVLHPVLAKWHIISLIELCTSSQMKEDSYGYQDEYFFTRDQKKIGFFIYSNLTKLTILYFNFGELRGHFWRILSIVVEMT